MLQKKTRKHSPKENSPNTTRRFAARGSLDNFFTRSFMTGRKNRALQVPPVVPYKALEKFSMGQQEVLAVHDFSVL